MRARDKYDFIGKISEKLGIPEEVVERACMSQWEFIRSEAPKLDLGTDITREEFDKLRTSFNLIGLGKLSISFRMLERINKNKLLKHLNNLKNGIYT